MYVGALYQQHALAMFRFWSIQEKAYREHIKKIPMDGGKNNHWFAFLVPGTSLTPARLCAATNLNPTEPDQTEPDTSLRGGEGFQTPTSFTCRTLFSSVILKVARNEVERNAGWDEKRGFEPSRDKTPSPPSLFHLAQRKIPARCVLSVGCTAPLATAPRQAVSSTLEK